MYKSWGMSLFGFSFIWVTGTMRPAHIIWEQNLKRNFTFEDFHITKNNLHREFFYHRYILWYAHSTANSYLLYQKSDFFCCFVFSSVIWSYNCHFLCNFQQWSISNFYIQCIQGVSDPITSYCVADTIIYWKTLTFIHWSTLITPSWQNKSSCYTANWLKYVYVKFKYLEIISFLDCMPLHLDLEISGHSGDALCRLVGKTVGRHFHVLLGLSFTAFIGLSQCHFWIVMVVSAGSLTVQSQAAQSDQRILFIMVI